MANEQSKTLILTVIKNVDELADKFYAGLAKWRQPKNKDQANSAALAHLSAVWMKAIESAEVLRDNVRRTFAGPKYLADQTRALEPAQDVFTTLREMKAKIIGGTAGVRITQNIAAQQFANTVAVVARSLKLIANYLQKNEIISVDSKAVIDEQLAGLSEREAITRAA
jgi:hypothetical protein